MNPHVELCMSVARTIVSIWTQLTSDRFCCCIESTRFHLTRCNCNYNRPVHLQILCAICTSYFLFFFIHTAIIIHLFRELLESAETSSCWAMIHLLTLLRMNRSSRGSLVSAAKCASRRDRVSRGSVDCVSACQSNRVSGCIHQTEKEEEEKRMHLHTEDQWIAINWRW